jgi:hypothetical protein
MKEADWRGWTPAVAGNLATSRPRAHSVARSRWHVYQQGYSGGRRRPARVFSFLNSAAKPFA